jgi:TonB family protein
MTFKSSLYISIAMHIVIFGSAIAFAQYAGAIFTPFPHVFPVSLVGLGGGGGHGRDGQVREGSRSKDTVPQPAELPAEPRKAERPEDRDDLHAAAAAVEAGRQVSSNGGSSAGDGRPTSLASAGASGPGTGSIVSSQWAVISEAIERTKNYPRSARERGVEGVVRLRFRMNASGSVDKIEIVESSGSDVLDNASVRAVYRAAPLPYVQGWVEVPISYVLK